MIIMYKKYFFRLLLQTNQEHKNIFVQKTNKGFGVHRNVKKKNPNIKQFFIIRTFKLQ